MKVQIHFEVDLKCFLPLFANASDSIYILFPAINFYGPTVTFGHYVSYLFTKNYAKLCDDKSYKERNKNSSWRGIISRVCTSFFISNKILFRKKHLKAYLTHL